jgi:PAT family beta-lactamase induction signal transducer AmpG
MSNHNLLFVMLLFGMLSGLSALLAGNTLNFWLAKEGIDIISIGLFSMAALPYACNFIWAPIIESYKIPFLYRIFGRRKSWCLFLQILLSLFIILLSITNPTENISMTAVCALIVSFIASTQDINLNGMRAELLQGNNIGTSSSTYIMGYRLGTLIGSSGAIYLSIYISWQSIYLLFSITSFIFSILIISISPDMKEPLNNQLYLKNKSWYEAIIKPIGGGKFLLIILIFLVLYRLADNFINVMINPFLLYAQFNEFEIATVSKGFGLVSSVAGSLVAGIFIGKNIYRSLYIFGLIHFAAHLLFIMQAEIKYNIILLYSVIGFESFTGGMTMAAYIALITSLCKGPYSGTQYSFLSSMMGVSRAFCPAFSGYIVYYSGWTKFFIFTSILAIPSLLMLRYILIKNSIPTHEEI